MDFEIRKAGSKDTESIQKVLTESRAEYLPYAPIKYSDQEISYWIREILLAKSDVWVAVIDKLIVGVCSSSSRGFSTWIDQLYILPGYTGNTIGSSLLNSAVNYSKFQHIKVVCFKMNQPAQQFYKQHGFQVVEERDGSDNEEDLPDLILQKKVF